MHFTPMPLAVAHQPFDDPNWIFELKWDEFRALAHIVGHHCRLVSRRGNTYKSWPYLCDELAHAVRCQSAVLDGEIICLDDDGRPNFHKLLFRREWPYFFAFDLLELNGEDLRHLPLVQRKRRLKGIMPAVESRVRYVDHLREQGTAFFRAACEHDLEGIVAKWSRGTYQADGRTSWLKINEKRRPMLDRAAWTKPELVLR
jgi:bifunctional non-homologous end joining protein LigD